MKNYAKTGKRPGRPAYRTPAHFRFSRHLAGVKAAWSGGQKTGSCQSERF